MGKFKQPKDNASDFCHCYRCQELINTERDTHIVEYRFGEVFCSLTCFMRHYQAEIVNEVEVPY